MSTTQPSRRVMHPRDVVLEEVEHFLSFGYRAAGIAERLDMRPETIARALYRAERPDLARLFQAAGTRRWKKRNRKPHPCEQCGGPVKSAQASLCVSCGCTQREQRRRDQREAAA